MFDGNRLRKFSVGRIGAYIILSSIVCTAAYLLNAQHHENERAKARQVDMAPAIATCTSGGEGVLDMLCVIEELKAQRESGHNDADLKAQQEMAGYALLMLIVTGFGVIFVAQTLGETRKAVVLQGAANEGFKESAEKQLRAYVSVTQKTVFAQQISSGSPPEQTLMATILIVFRNCGQTPAHKLIYQGRMFLADRTGEEVVSIVIRKSEAAETLGPGVERIIEIKAHLPHQTIKPGGNLNDSRVAARGEITYIDEFSENERHTRFQCVSGDRVLRMPRNTVIQMEPMPGHNDAD